MVKYETLTKYMVELANRHPNIQFVKFDNDVDAINDPSYKSPSFIISPTQCILNENSFVNYGFQLLYLDKLTQEEDNYDNILEDGSAYMLGFIEVLNLKYKVIKGITLDPILTGFDGGMLVGFQANIEIEAQFNFEKFMSPFYGDE